MILGYANEQTRRFAEDGQCPAQWRPDAKVAARQLDMLDAAPTLDTLRSPPGNRLEALKADRFGQSSIRSNERWHICFAWTALGPDQVEIVDYH